MIDGEKVCSFLKLDQRIYLAKIGNMQFRISEVIIEKSPYYQLH